MNMRQGPEILAFLACCVTSSTSLNHDDSCETGVLPLITWTIVIVKQDHGHKPIFFYLSNIHIQIIIMVTHK